MPMAIRRSNGRKSIVRARIEHVFAEQKDRMGLFIRTIGLARAEIKIGLANLVYNIKRFIWLSTSWPPLVRRFRRVGRHRLPLAQERGIPGRETHRGFPQERPHPLTSHFLTLQRR